MKNLVSAVETVLMKVVSTATVDVQKAFAKEAHQLIIDEFGVWESEWKSAGYTLDDPLYWGYREFLYYWGMRVDRNDLEGWGYLGDLVSRHTTNKREDLVDMAKTAMVSAYWQFRYLNLLAGSNVSKERVILTSHVARLDAYLLNPFQRVKKKENVWAHTISEALGCPFSYHAPVIEVKRGVINHLLNEGVIIYTLSEWNWNLFESFYGDVARVNDVIRMIGTPNSRNPLMGDFLACLNEMGGVEIPRRCAFMNKRVFETVLTHRLLPEVIEKGSGMAMVSKSKNLTPDAQAIRDIFSGNPRRNDFVEKEDRKMTVQEREILEFREGPLVITCDLGESLYDTEQIRLTMWESPACEGDGVDANVNALDTLKLGITGMYVAITPKYTLYAPANRINFTWNWLKEAPDADTVKEVLLNFLDNGVGRFNRPVYLGEVIHDDIFLKGLEGVLDELTPEHTYESAMEYLFRRMSKLIPIMVGSIVDPYLCVNGIRMTQTSIRILTQETRIPDEGVRFFYDHNTLSSSRFTWMHDLVERLHAHFLGSAGKYRASQVHVTRAQYEKETQILWVKNWVDFVVERIDSNTISIRKRGSRTMYFSKLS
jgi:hypothetical protein